ncbi:protein phosphatase 2C 37 [Pyrus x bretschneideri]|uniref:protein phosphatase 2C 37 n=1 Tax=Pyrus x bretschneideri TaxID=225117 RepID=UPI00203068FD|nr:protein phosphatase 2C 37 [Pyrus x bretschneideri]
MAGMCCGVVGESEASAATTTTTTTMDSSSRTSRRRRLDLLPLKYIAELAVQPTAENGRKRQKIDMYRSLSSVPQNAAESSKEGLEESKPSATVRVVEDDAGVKDRRGDEVSESVRVENKAVQAPVQDSPRFGMTSVCGRRRDMEDAVSIHPSFLQKENPESNRTHFYGVFDGHGCSHVALKCKDRLHEIVKQELETEGETVQWKDAMERSFLKMDEEVQEGNLKAQSSNCRCELQTPQCDAVGSTAVVAIVTPEKIVVSNCGDSRAVLCRSGAAVPLSSDHKPDRPDELVRIEAAGGRVIYWDGARVLGVLAMSRAIGDNYLKPYVISEPDVTVTDRTAEDECLILASDGLWDVVSNDTACGVVRMCLRAQTAALQSGLCCDAAASSDKACSDASILLTKLALARQSSDNVSVVVVDLRRPGRS